MIKRGAELPWGSSAPRIDFMTDFLMKKQNARDILKLHWGYEEFRPGQEKVIDNVLEGRSTVVIMPTGGGKSLCYQLPSLVLDGVTIVISPLIALMKDQVDSLERIGIPATFVNSAISQQEISFFGHPRCC